MSKELDPFTLSVRQCESDLVEFGKLLAGKVDLDEQADVLAFFRSAPHLGAFIGTFHLPVERIDRFAFELDVFGHFRTDLAVGDSTTRAYSLIEFEDAKRRSVFDAGTKYNDEWGGRIEHGFSQLVDWFWTIEDQRSSKDFARRFGGSDARFFAMLIVGRRAYVDDVGRARLDWRARNVAIAGHHVTCITFDELYDGMRSKLNYLRAIADAGDLP